MDHAELKKLNRQELLEILVMQSKRIDELQAQLDAAQATLDERTLMLDEAGSIAEASLRLNGVFEAAQAAANQYIESVKALAERRGQAASVIGATGPASAAGSVDPAGSAQTAQVQKIFGGGALPANISRAA